MAALFAGGGASAAGGAGMASAFSQGGPQQVAQAPGIQQAQPPGQPAPGQSPVSQPTANIFAQGMQQGPNIQQNLLNFLNSLGKQ